jgi:alkylation response protein AidB-like acyl-CoA dehydrogenase
MDFELTEEQQLALDSWRGFLERDIRPLTDECLDRLIPKEAALRLLQMGAQYGMCCAGVPEADGGLGLDILTSGLISEELARVSPDLAGIGFVSEGVSLKLARGGTAELKARYLPGLLSGELIGSSAVSEPDAGSDVRAIKTRAVRDGDNYRITGEKLWTSNITISDLVIILARTDEDEFTIFLVDREEHGYESREIPKLGLDGWSLGQVILDDVVVPAGNAIGGIGGGLAETMRGFERARCFISTLALGISRAALDDAIAYAQQRTSFGKLIGSHQLIQALIAEMATELDAARLLVYRGLKLLNHGRPFPVEAGMCKSFATEAATRITSKAIQVHGAFGISKEFAVERHFRNARLLTIPDGTTEINKLIIARNLLGLNAFGN